MDTHIEGVGFYINNTNYTRTFGCKTETDENVIKHMNFRQVQTFYFTFI